MHMSVSEEATRKETCRLTTHLEGWGCTNFPRYHANMFHTYRNFPNKRDPGVAEWANQSIQEYDQRTFMMGGSRGDRDIKGKRGQIYSTEMHSMFADRRAQIALSWKE